MKYLQLPIILALSALMSCGGTETKTITEIVQVPTPEPTATAINLNINASEISGALSNNGNEFPNSIYQDADILFQGSNATDEFKVGSTPFQSYQAMIVNGNYNAVYKVDSTGPDIPQNQSTVLFSEREISLDETIDLDVTSIAITATFTLNGSSFPASQYDHGLFYLQPVGTNELILMGSSNTVNDPIRIIPGEYHIIYDYVQGSISPINKLARISSNLMLTADDNLRVNVASGDFRATLTLNGSAFPSSQYDHGEIFLIDRLSGGKFFIMKTFETNVTAAIIDGSYDVLYKVVQSSLVPLNSAKIIQEDFSLSGGGALVADVLTHTINANVLLNDMPFQVSEYQDGIIELYDSQTDSYTKLGNTHGNFDGLIIIPGTYDVTYSHETGDLVPQNMQGVVTANQTINSDSAIDINVVGILVSPEVTLNASAFPQSQNQSADFILAGTLSSQPLIIGATNNQNESAMIMPGTYDFIYRHDKGEKIPKNSHYLIAAAQAIQSETTLSANINSAYIRVAATLNQQAFPQSQYQTGNIIASSGYGDQVQVLETHTNGDIIQLAAGEYQFFYQHDNGDNVPINNWALIDSVTINDSP